MNWNCTNIEERLSDYLDGMLSPVEMAAFHAHSATCADCGKLVASVSGLVTRMHGLEAVAESPLLVNRILDSTIGPRVQKEGWTRWFSWTTGLLQPRFTMGLVTVAATILILIYTGGFTPSKLKKADLSPVNAFRSANRQAHLTYARSVKYVNDLRVVYEIQSRLQPSAEPSPEIPAPSMQNDQSQPKHQNPQEKSQTSPNPGHSQSRTVAMLASIVNPGLVVTMNAVNRSAR